MAGAPVATRASMSGRGPRESDVGCLSSGAENGNTVLGEIRGSGLKTTLSGWDNDCPWVARSPPRSAEAYALLPEATASRHVLSHKELMRMRPPRALLCWLAELNWGCCSDTTLVRLEDWFPLDWGWCSDTTLPRLDDWFPLE